MKFNSILIDKSCSTSLFNGELLHFLNKTPDVNDVLLACVTYHRLRTENFLKINHPSDAVMFVTEDDLLLTNNIREYYGKKFTWLAMTSEKEFSTFRKKFIRLINNKTPIELSTEDDISVLFHVCLFYEYDQKFDRIKHEVNSIEFEVPNINAEKEFTLKPLEILSRNNKFFEYWFVDMGTKRPMLSRIDHINPLKNMWDLVFKNNDTLRVKGRTKLNSRDNFKYLEFTKWHLML